MNYYLESAYIQHTISRPQIDIRSLQPVLPVLNDSTRLLNIKRTQADIANITLPASKPLKLPAPVTPLKITEQVMTLQDSLKFNLTEREDVYTNWNLMPDYNPESFNESLYSEIDEQLFVSPEQQGIPAYSPIRLENHVQDSLSLLLYNATQPDKGIDTPKNSLQGNNIFLMLILVAVLLTGFVKFYRRDYIGSLLRSVFFQGVAGNISTKNSSYSFSAFIMGFLFFFNSSLFIYELFTLTGNSIFVSDSLQNIPIIFASLTILYFAKILIFHIAGFIFDTSPQIKLYLKGLSTKGQAYAIIILPVIVLFPFINQLGQTILVNTGESVFILLYLLQTGRGIKIILKETLSLYYIILYLCSLEILPLLILFKIIFES